MLFETMMQRPGERAKIAANFAEYMHFDAEADRAQIGRELAAILERRERLEADAEALAYELAARCSAAQDFADIPGTDTPGPDALAQLEKTAQDAAAAEGRETAERLAADIAALDALFLTICRALDAEGLTLSGGEISALKRQRMPDTLAAALDTLKRRKIATIPAAERLTAQDARALFDGLTAQGFISGDYSAFSYCLAQQSAGNAKRPKNGLSWAGTPGEFAYFVQRLEQYNAARLKPYQPGPNITALCRTFGIDAQTQKDKVTPPRTHRNKPRGRTAEIAAIFSALPGLNIKESKDE